MSAGLRPYRRRRPRPVAITVGALAVAALVTWTIVFVNSSADSGLAACNAPASGSAGSVLDADALASAAPTPPANVRATVLNAGGQRGQANLVAAQLGDLGFGEARQPDNDSLYPTGNLDCHGQLRFGQSGQGAAATLQLVLPCLELVQDERGDDSVDVAVGTAFTDVNPVRAVRDALEQLGAPGSGETGEGQQVATPQLDPQVLAEARDAARC
ncbi:envelope integrity protein Cei [Pseudonocardia sp. RS11V-5]|uniref:envelope integrity protein Cei n=1 Tax=Pseudonocardia terrae TaxID=2905831 RepID=UPI001E45CC6A|nr:envelope integrity protein Cei [Pseudonocardia terrae]MCE3553885.1 envelope integrity protein Cei [Pseudonocardia terrae]